jgi:c-di-GMP-binding flagellar brake protein YcgR
MPSILKKWFRRELPVVLSPAQKTTMVKLEQWLRERRKLSVSILGDHQSYQSLMVALQPERNCFLMDELFPYYAGQLSLVGQTLKVSLREHGREMYVQCHCLAETTHQGLPAYVLKIPQHLMQTQRRRGYRALIAGQIQQNDVILRLASTALDAQTVLISALVRDVSIWGIGLMVQKDLREIIKVGLHTVANIAIQDFLNAEVFLEIKNIRYDENTAVTTLGCVFLSMAQPVQSQLQKKITELQRTQVRQLYDSQVV